MASRALGLARYLDTSHRPWEHPPLPRAISTVLSGMMLLWDTLLCITNCQARVWSPLLFDMESDTIN